MPPSWQTDNREIYPKESQVGDGKGTGRARTVKSGRPWYVPRVSLGAGLNIPELVPLESWFIFGKWFGLRLFYTPPMPFNIRVEMPSDVISTKKGVGVANPDFTIRLRAIYGPMYGMEAVGFPFGGSFFLFAGGSYRKMRITGHAQSPILICSLIEAAKDPPCGDENAAIQTQTEIVLDADVETRALLARGGLGWFWHIGSSGYFVLNAGATKPLRITRSVDVQANLDAPTSVDPEITGALLDVKTDKEAELEEKAIREMRPVEERVLPIIGISAGIRL